MEAKNKENTICTVFSHRMSQLLEANKKSRKDVCRDLDIKYTTFCDWINGRNIPKAPQIERLCDYFGVEPAYFFIETEPENASERFATRVSAYAKMLQHKTLDEKEDTMSKALEDMRNEVAERVTERVEKETKLDAIKSVMKTLGVSVEKAMETLEIPKAQWNTYIGLLDK